MLTTVFGRVGGRWSLFTSVVVSEEIQRYSVTASERPFAACPQHSNQSIVAMLSEPLETS